jgi:hypothetical protein
LDGLNAFGMYFFFFLAWSLFMVPFYSRAIKRKLPGKKGLLNHPAGVKKGPVKLRLKFKTPK